MGIAFLFGVALAILITGVILVWVGVRGLANAVRCVYRALTDDFSLRHLRR